MGSPLFLCKNITMNTGILFNLWDFCPDYKSASDGIMTEQLMKSMEESEHGLPEPVFPTLPVYLSAASAAANGQARTVAGTAIPVTTDATGSAAAANKSDMGICARGGSSQKLDGGSQTVRIADGQ